MQSDRLGPGDSGALPLAFTFCALSASTADFALANVAGDTARVLGGYTTVCTSLTLGRMDCVGLDDFDHRIWCGDMRHEENTGFSKSTQEENC